MLILKCFSFYLRSSNSFSANKRFSLCIIFLFAISTKTVDFRKLQVLFKDSMYSHALNFVSLALLCYANGLIL